MKIKKYGKNQRQLKKLLTNGAKIFKDSVDWTEIFKNLIGFEYIFRTNRKGLEIVDPLGDIFILESKETFEIV